MRGFPWEVGVVGTGLSAAERFLLGFESLGGGLAGGRGREWELGPDGGFADSVNSRGMSVRWVGWIEG